MTWSTTPKAKRFLSALDPARLAIRWHNPIIGDRELHIIGCTADDEGINEQLDKLRTAYVDAKFGMTFLEAEREGRGDEYLSAWSSQPTVQDVLAERFGDPNRFRGFGENRAQRLWREGALERISQRKVA